jgi:hypothetical protein
MDRRARNFQVVVLWMVSVTGSLFAVRSSMAQQPTGEPEKKDAVAIPLKPKDDGAHENLYTLTREDTNLKPEKPFLIETDDLAGTNFIRQRYTLQWRPGDAMDVYVVMPRGVKNPPVVLYLYDFPQDTERYKNNGWCERATAQGYAAVGMVSALTGHRYHDRPMKEWFVSELRESLVSSVHDVQYILDYLQTRNDVDMSRVAMFGVGSGGTIAILAAAVDPRITVLDVLSPWGDWPEWVAGTVKVRPEEHELFGKKEFLQGVAPFDPVDWFARVKTGRVRLQNIRTDIEVPVKAQEKIEAAAPATALVNQFGDELAFRNATTSGRAFDWVKMQLKADAPAVLTADRQANTHFIPAQGRTLPDANKPFHYQVEAPAPAQSQPQ